MIVQRTLLKRAVYVQERLIGRFQCTRGSLLRDTPKTSSTSKPELTLSLYAYDYISVSCKSITEILRLSSIISWHLYRHVLFCKQELDRHVNRLGHATHSSAELIQFVVPGNMMATYRWSILIFNEVYISPKGRYMSSMRNLLNQSTTPYFPVKMTLLCT